jgi:hypothetical protein
LTIEFFETQPLTMAQRDAFHVAADRWEAKLSDPIAVKVNIGFSNLPSGVLGSTLTQRTTHPYSTVRSAMYSDAFSFVEKASVDMLPLASVPLQDINGVRSDTMVTMATANAKALGLGTGLDPLYGAPLPNSADGRIYFANAFADTFDYDPTDGISAGLTDFVGVATHEIGHLLGFFSMTDIQDNPANSSLTLHPNTLDLWRFGETGAPHTIGSENRRVTRGPAEYDDSGLSNRQLSRGTYDTVTDPVCGTFSGKCQASHWRDSLGNLMDPTVADGVAVNILSEDARAIDYIGYNRALLLMIQIPREILVGWFDWPFPDPPPIIPDFDGAFDQFPDPPKPESIGPNLPFEPDFGARLGLDFGIDGLQARSGLGLVQFQDEVPNQLPLLEGHSDDLIAGEQNLEPIRDPFEIIPPVIRDLYFVSDEQGGVPFTARAMLSDLGAQLDKSLGEFGGYRVPIMLDGMADDVVGDTDAVATLLLLASDETMVPDPKRLNIFTIDGSELENSLIFYDPEALGIRRTLLTGDLDCDGDVDFDDIDDLVLGLNDPSRYEAVFGVPPALKGDTDGDGDLDFDDIPEFVRLLGNAVRHPVPEPATTVMLLIAVGALTLARMSQCRVGR